MKRRKGVHLELTYHDVCVTMDTRIPVRHVMEIYDGPAAGCVRAEGHSERSLEADPL